MQFISFQDAPAKILREAKMDRVLEYIKEKNKIKKDVLKKFNPEAIVNGEIDYKFGDNHDNIMPVKCLFHPTSENDSTSILLDGNIMYCFVGGCPAGIRHHHGKQIKGLNVINVYMALVKGIPMNAIGTKAASTAYSQTIYELAEFCGYKIKNEAVRLTPAQKKQNTIQNVLNDTQKIYQEAFWASQEAQDYWFEERGFKWGISNDEINPKKLAEELGVGFAPEEFPTTHVYDKLISKYTTEELIQASVIRWVQFKDTKGNVKDEKPFDFHSNAITLPYRVKNKPKAHYGRMKMTKKELEAILSQAKNDEEREALKKKIKKRRHNRSEGGLDEPINMEKAIRYKVVLASEGEITYASMVALGYPNSMGTQGTNGLTDEHIEKLVKAREESNGEFCRKIVIVYDGDKAGRDAAIKNGLLLLEKGFEVEIVIMPDGMDVNDLLTTYEEKAKAVFDKLVSEAVSYYTFVAIQEIKKEYASQNDRLKEYRRVKSIIREQGINDEVEIRLIAKEVAEVTKVSLDVILEAWKPLENKNTEVFYNNRYVFMSNDLEGYFLTKSTYESTTYVEDVEFTFLEENKVITKTLIVDKDFYSEEDKNSIKQFCNKLGIRMMIIPNFKNVFKMDKKEFMEALMSDI